MSKFIFGCMNIGNTKDSSINLIESIGSSGLIICENSRKFKIFLNKMYIKTNALIVEWPHDIIDNYIPEYILDQYKNMEVLINENINNNKNILILSDEGSSLLLDPGDYFFNFCLKNNIKYEIMPGPSAVMQSFLHNKIFSSYYSKFYFCGWFSNLSHDEKIKIINIINNLDCPVIMFLWNHSLIEDLKFLINNNIDKKSTICINLTYPSEFVLTDSLSKIYNALLNNDIYIDEESLISLVIN